jgi:hypothetical protein
MQYKILSENYSVNKICVCKKFEIPASALQNKIVKIQAGKNQLEVEITASSHINDDTVMLSQNVIDKLALPLDLTYQLNLDSDTIYIGPIIGLLLKNKINKLDKVSLQAFSRYAYDYHEHYGLLYIFSLDSIDFDNNLIEGFYYNPNIMKGELQWTKRTLPFPDTIFRRIPLTKVMQKKLINLTNNKMFNSHYSDKWEFYCTASKYEPVIKYLPFTKLLTSIDDIENLLEIYDKVYIKPTDGSLGHGLKIISKENGEYFFKDRYDEKSIRFSSKSEASGFIKGLISKRDYVAQQAINSLKFQNRNTHLRVIMQKNETMKWNCTGIVAYMGKAGGICTIYPEGWYGLSFGKFIRKFMPKNSDNITEIEKEIINACYKTCEMLDTIGGNYGDVGIDVIVDENFKIWILEVNKRHNQRTPLAINNIQMFNDVKINPIKYAVALSGFKVTKSKGNN